MNTRALDVHARGFVSSASAVDYFALSEPGLSRHPAAERIDIDENGEVVGLS
jgi:formyltetrahydrofolate synthetase